MNSDNNFEKESHILNQRFYLLLENFKKNYVLHKENPNYHVNKKKFEVSLDELQNCYKDLVLLDNKLEKKTNSLNYSLRDDRLQFNSLKEENVKLKEIVNLDMVYNEKWKYQQNLNLLKHICKLNKKSFTPKFANYFTDISPFQKYYDNPFNIIVGPGIIQQAHQTNEYVKKVEIIRSRKIYEYLINEIC